jgi:acetyltransferase
MRLLIRPVRPEDELLYGQFLSKITPQDLRLRFFATAKNFTHGFIARFTQIDYARAMAFAAIYEATGEFLGVSRIHILTHRNAAEFGILVRSDVKGQGIGWLLMRALLDYARVEGIDEIVGEVLADNAAMLQMCKELGFSVTTSDEDAGVRRVKLRLAPSEALSG